jgi:hypothetical protein
MGKEISQKGYKGGFEDQRKLVAVAAAQSSWPMTRFLSVSGFYSF